MHRTASIRAPQMGFRVGASTRARGLLSCLFRFAQIRPISQSNTLLERGARLPAQFSEAANIEQFARGAVRAGVLEADWAGVADGFGVKARAVGGGDIVAGVG